MAETRDPENTLIITLADGEVIVEMLPEVAQRAGLLLPATYGMVAFNGLAMGETAVFAPWAAVAILAGSGLLSFGLALYLFSWDNRNAARRGHPLLALLALLPLVVGIFWL